MSRRLALACVFALLASCAQARAMLADPPAPAPAAPPSDLGLVVSFADPACIGTANITEPEAPYFGANATMPVFEAAVTADFIRAGMAPDGPPACAAIASQLMTPCTAGFRATRGEGGDTLYLQPLASIYVAAAPGCAVSHCQGGVATLSSAGNGTGAFYTRLTGEQTYPITLSLTEAGQVAVGVGTPLGVACTLLYAAVGASATNVLDA